MLPASGGRLSGRLLLLRTFHPVRLAIQTMKCDACGRLLDEREFDEVNFLHRRCDRTDSNITLAGLARKTFALAEFFSV
jgi:hypothetical protein